MSSCVLKNKVVMLNLCMIKAKFGAINRLTLVKLKYVKQENYILYF